MTVDEFGHVRTRPPPLSGGRFLLQMSDRRSLIKTIERDDAISPETFGRIERLIGTSMQTEGDIIAFGLRDACRERAVEIRAARKGYDRRTLVRKHNPQPSDSDRNSRSPKAGAR